MQSLIRQIITAVLIAASLLTNIAVAAPNAEIGWVVEVKGAAKDITLIRDGKPFGVGVTTLLRRNDIIRADGKASVSLLLGENKKIVITAANSPYVVDYDGAPPTIIGNLQNYASNFLLTYVGRGKEPSVPGKVLMGRESAESEQFHAPLLQFSRIFLTESQEPLKLAWRGGTPPYAIQVIGPNGKAKVYEGITRKDFVIDPHPAYPRSTYRLELRDAQGKVISNTLEVVPPTLRPAPPKSLNEAQLALANRQILYAAWLATQREGDWLLEAYQLLAEFPNDPSAVFITKSIERGALK